MKHIFYEVQTLTYRTGKARLSGTDEQGEQQYAVDWSDYTVNVFSTAHYDADLHVYVADADFADVIAQKRRAYRELLTVDTEAQAIRAAVTFADNMVHLAQQCIPSQPLEDDLIDEYKAHLNTMLTPTH